MTLVKIKPNSGDVVATSERGKEEKPKQVINKNESLISRMIGIIIMDIKHWISGGKSTNDYDIESRVNQWRKEVSRRKK